VLMSVCDLLGKEELVWWWSCSSFTCLLAAHEIDCCTATSHCMARHLALCRSCAPCLAHIDGNGAGMEENERETCFTLTMDLIRESTS
jgi:hypothetical protein